MILAVAHMEISGLELLSLHDHMQQTDLEPGQGEPTQTDRDCWGPFAPVIYGLLGPTRPKLLWGGSFGPLESRPLQPSSTRSLAEGESRKIRSLSDGWRLLSSVES